MDKDKKNPRPSDDPVHNAEMDELFRRLQPEMRRPKPSADAIAAALEAAQRLAAEADAEQASDDAAQELSGDSSTVVCPVCGYRNRDGNKFCAMCGISVSDQQNRPGTSGRRRAPSPCHATHFSITIPRPDRRQLGLQGRRRITTTIIITTTIFRVEKRWRGGR